MHAPESVPPLAIASLSNPRVQIIFNPMAGQAAQVESALRQATQLWVNAGWQVDQRATRWAGDATTLAAEAAASGYEVVVAAGGDGTVNEVMNGLVGTATALAVLPAGTVNIWAREMGLPMDVVPAAQELLEAERRRIDVGRAVGRKIQPRHFLLMAGVGFDAAVTAGVKAADKRWLGTLGLGAIAYVKQALQLAWRYQGRRIKLRVDGKRVRGRILMVVVGNSQLYGGVVKFTAHALVDDGKLDVCVIKGRSLWVAPLRLLTVCSRGYNRDPKVKYFQAEKIEFLGRRKLPIQLDGDYLGKTPVTFEVVPQSLWVLAPPRADASLWSNATTTALNVSTPQTVLPILNLSLT